MLQKGDLLSFTHHPGHTTIVMCRNGSPIVHQEGGSSKFRVEIETIGAALQLADIIAASHGMRIEYRKFHDPNVWNFELFPSGE